MAKVAQPGPQALLGLDDFQEGDSTGEDPILPPVKKKETKEKEKTKEIAGTRLKWRSLVINLGRVIFTTRCGEYSISTSKNALFLKHTSESYAKYSRYMYPGQGGQAARPGTEFLWSPQLRNLAEQD